MTDTNPRDLIQSLSDALYNAIRVIEREDGTQHIDTARPVLAEARAYLAQLEPEVPTEEEILRHFPMTEQKSTSMMINCQWYGPPPSPHASVSDWFEQEGSKGVLYGLRISPLPSRGGNRSPKPPSLKEEALVELDNMIKAAKDFGFGGTNPIAIEEIEREAIANADTDDEYRAFKNGAFFVQERMNRPVIEPVPASERPWEREGWCDADGRCWWGRPSEELCNSGWFLATRAEVEEFCDCSPPVVSLPHHALPVPTTRKDD